MDPIDLDLAKRTLAAGGTLTRETQELLVAALSREREAVNSLRAAARDGVACALASAMARGGPPSAEEWTKGAEDVVEWAIVNCPKTDRTVAQIMRLAIMRLEGK